MEFHQSNFSMPGESGGSDWAAPQGGDGLQPPPPVAGPPPTMNAGNTFNNNSNMAFGVGSEQIHQRHTAHSDSSWQVPTGPPPAHPPGHQQQQHQSQQPQVPFNFGGGTDWKPSSEWAMAGLVGLAAKGAHPDMLPANIDFAGNHMQQKVMPYLDGLRIYFRVTNRYVLSKLKIISFPFTHNFARHGIPYIQEGAEYPYESPERDSNGLDLYIPFMALVTYVLLSAAIMGVNNAFKPEVLGTQASWCFAVNFLEVLLLKCFSFGAISHMYIFDTACISGYKYVGICLSLLARIFLPSPLYWLPFVWCCACSAFMIRAQLLEHFKTSEGKVVAKSQPMLLCAAAAQPFIYLFLISNILG
eukprot:TRINITY_DN596_c6_g1_i1.p1 TRINITY_DN596_c6_g1~~TRINITY_DN596_c6_g1_i1.p1  ORF type:complete len:358 (+),score=44.78 TRINITY_DN596_c6_g1_i1:108-1181(+)